MGYDSMGMMMYATGSVSGNTWSWKSTDKMGGKPFTRGTPSR